MNNLVDKNKFNIFCEEYYKSIVELMKKMDTDKLIEMIEAIKVCYLNNNTIFLIGNGGSASTCSHMANDMGIGTYNKSNGKKLLKIVSLTDNNSIITAISNDDSFENTYVKQLELLFKEGDLLIAMSCSGNSINLIKALKWVNKRNGKTISIVGFDGGIMKNISDISIHNETEIGNYGLVENLHMMINHLISLWIQREDM